MFQDNNIKAFLTLAETLSYTKTAKQMYMSQQAVSRCIAMLEEDLDTQLFIRTTRSVGLTAAGRLYYNLYKDLYRQYDERLAQIRLQIEGDDAERIRLGCQSFISIAPVIDAVASMRETQPDLSIEVVCVPPSLLVEDFRRGEVDAVVILDRFIPDNLSCGKKELSAHPLYLMVATSNPDATDQATYRDFMHLPFVSDVLDGEDSLAHRLRIEHDISTWGLTPESIVWAFDRAAAFAFAELGYGIIVDSNIVNITAGRRLRAYETGMSESVWLLYRENGKHDATLKLLIKRLAREFHKAGY